MSSDWHSPSDSFHRLSINNDGAFSLDCVQTKNEGCRSVIFMQCFIHIKLMVDSSFQCQLGDGPKRMLHYDMNETVDLTGNSCHYLLC